MEPEYEGHDTVSITPIYDTDFSIIWLRNQQNKNLKSYFYDHTAPRKRLRTKDEVPENVSTRNDVAEMLLSPEAAEQVHARLAAEEILRNQDSITVVAE